MIFVVRWIECCKEISQKSIKKRSRKQTPLCNRILIAMILEIFWEGKTGGNPLKNRTQKRSEKNRSQDGPKAARRGPSQIRPSFFSEKVSKSAQVGSQNQRKIDQESEEKSIRNRIPVFH